VRRLLEARARRQPLVVVLDDVNWGEPTFLDLVEHIPDWSHDAPILLLCMARPELLEVRPAWAAAKPHATTLVLEPLAYDETRMLIENLVGAVDDAIFRRVIEAAEGNPLFVEEMLAMLVEDGMSTTSVPATIQVLLAARLDRLEAGERRVLECAAVEGKEFHGGAVATLAGQPVGDALFSLVRKDLVRPHRAAFAGEDGFQFRHILFRDAAYEALPKSRRAELHERYADWLERVAHERLLEYEELLGYHLEQAFRCRSEVARVDDATQALASRAGGHLSAAGRRAAARGDMTAAANLLGRASSLLVETTSDRLEVLLELSTALRETGALEQAQRTLVQLRQLSAQVGDRRLETYASLDDAFLRLFTHGGEGVEDIRREAAAAVSLFEELGDEAGLAKAWYHTACASVASARWAEATEALSTALDRARKVGDQSVIRAIVRQLASAAVAGPDSVDEALRRCAELQEEVAEDRLLHARLTVATGYLEALRGRFDEARGLCDMGARTLRELGATLTLATLCLLTGAVELLAGRPEAAERELRASLGTLTAMGEKGVLSAVAAQLAEALLAQGRDAEALEAASLSERTTTRGDVQSEVAWRSVRAKLAARRGAAEEGLALARDAVEIAAGTDALIWRADALVALATVAEDEEAGRAAQEALRLYRAKGSVVGGGRGEALLASSGLGSAVSR
jgi:predicted ATPase